MTERSLLNVSWFCELEPAVQREVERHLHVAGVRRDRTLYYQEDSADTAYLVLDGSIRHVKWTDSGTTVLIAHTFQGEWLGLAETCRRGVYLTDATANGDSIVASTSASDLYQLLNYESFRRRIVTELSSGYYVLHGIIEAHSPQSKIARYLRSLLKHVSDESDWYEEIQITQELIAQAIGLSRETVNKHLHELEAQNIIRLARGVIRVINLSHLETTANFS